MSSFRTCWTKSTILRYWKDVWQQGKTKHLNYGNVSRTSKPLVQKVWNIKMLEGCQATGKTKHLNYGNVSRTSKPLVQKVWNIKILEGCQAKGKNKTLKLWKCVPHFKTLSAKSVEY